MFWMAFFIFLGTFVVTELLRPKPKLENARPTGLDEFGIPTATEGRYVPIIIGKVKVSGPNVVWYGDYKAIPIKKKIKTGLFSSSNIITGFKYYLSLQLAVCRGPVDGYSRIWLGDKLIFGPLETTGITTANFPTFFGGTEDNGMLMNFKLIRGITDDPVDAFIAARQSPSLTYQNTAYFIVSDGAGQGAYIGNQGNLRPLAFELFRYPNGLGVLSGHHKIGEDANPICFLFELLTDADWGLGINPGDVDITNLIAAAETCWTEGLGFSASFDSSREATELISEIERHVDGYFRLDITDGKFKIILARSDYDINTLPVANPDNILKVTSFSRGDWSQTQNECRVQFADRTKDYGESFALAQDMANKEIQGRRVPVQLRFPGLKNANAANKVAWREMRSMAYPLAKLSIEANRELWSLQPGSAFAYSWPDDGIALMAFRATRVRYGTGGKEKMMIDAVQDVYNSEIEVFAAPPPSVWVPSVQTVDPFPVADQIAIEAPYVINRFDEINPSIMPRAITFGRSASIGSATEYEMRTRTRLPPTAFSGAYTSQGFVQDGFMTVGVLRAAMTGLANGMPINGSHTLQVDPIIGSINELIDDFTTDESAIGFGLAVIEPGTANEEWVLARKIVVDGAGVRLEQMYRGALDRQIKAHALGVRIWFIWTGGMGLTTGSFAPGNGVDTKLLPRSPQDAVTEAEATSCTEISLANPARYQRPLTPDELFVNGVRLPSSSSADFDTDTGTANIPGLKISYTRRNWRQESPLLQSQGAIWNDLVSDKTDYRWWLYDLQTTPAPSSRAQAVISGNTGSHVANNLFVISRDAIVSAVGFVPNRLRIEIDTRIDTGTFIDTLEPFKFDFDCTSSFQTAFNLGDVAFNTAAPVHATQINVTGITNVLVTIQSAINGVGGTEAGAFYYAFDGGAWTKSTPLSAVSAGGQGLLQHTIAVGGALKMQIRHHHGTGGKILVSIFNPAPDPDTLLAFGSLVPETLYTPITLASGAYPAGAVLPYERTKKLRDSAIADSPPRAVFTATKDLPNLYIELDRDPYGITNLSEINLAVGQERGIYLRVTRVGTGIVEIIKTQLGQAATEGLAGTKGQAFQTIDPVTGVTPAAIATGDTITVYEAINGRTPTNKNLRVYIRESSVLPALAYFELKPGRDADFTSVISGTPNPVLANAGGAGNPPVGAVGSNDISVPRAMRVAIRRTFTGHTPTGRDIYYRDNTGTWRMLMDESGTAGESQSFLEVPAGNFRIWHNLDDNSTDTSLLELYDAYIAPDLTYSGLGAATYAKFAEYTLKYDDV